MYIARNGYEDVQKCIIACPRIKHRGNNRKKAPLNLVSLQKERKKKGEKRRKQGSKLSEMLNGEVDARCNRSFFRGSQS